MAQIRSDAITLHSVLTTTTHFGPPQQQANSLGPGRGKKTDHNMVSYFTMIFLVVGSVLGDTTTTSSTTTASTTTTTTTATTLAPGKLELVGGPNNKSGNVFYRSRPIW